MRILQNIWLFVTILAIGILKSFSVNSLQAQVTQWQQKCDYDIEVTLDDKTNRLDGFITLSYHNLSPDTLEEMYLHLWPNAYQNQSTDFAKQKLQHRSTKFYYSLEQERGGIDGLDFKANGKKLSTSYEANKEIARIALIDVLAPGDSVVVTTPFSVRIPKSFSRLGHVGESYQITQWYPKPAVFAPAEIDWSKDEARGNIWHTMPYLDQGEFYSEFGNFNVKISLPENYVVAASGDLETESELQWLYSLDQKTRALDSFGVDLKFPASSEKYKTLSYRLEKAHDFAWFADKRFHVLFDEVDIDGRAEPVGVWSFFTNQQAGLWSGSMNHMKRATKFYSEKVGPYAYNQVSAVQSALSAGAGMEYPTITVIGNSDSEKSFERVLVHEIGHNWFYGVLASNERQFPWMDEGINSYYEGLYFREFYPDLNILEFFGVEDKRFERMGVDQLSIDESYRLLYQYLARHKHDQPICLHSKEFTDYNYGLMVYMKTAMAFQYLQASLGESLFDRTMQSFYQKFKFTHPQPRDIRKHFEDETGKNLEWFFDDLLSTRKEIDYRLLGSQPEGDKIGERSYDVIEVMNFHDNVKGPYSISAIKEGEIARTIWYDGFSGVMEVLFPSGDYDGYELDAIGVIPELKRSNNRLKANGNKDRAGTKLKLLGGLEKDHKKQVFYAPFVGYNVYDKVMLGVNFYNDFFPGGNWEYGLTPMYSTNAETIVGTGYINKHVYPKKGMFRDVLFQVEGSRFHHGILNDRIRDLSTNVPIEPYHYNRISPSVKFELRNRSANSALKKLIELRHIYIDKQTFVESPDTNIFRFVSGHRQLEDYYVNELTLRLQNNRVINPFEWNVSIEQHPQFAKISSEFKFKFSYRNGKKGLNIRAFAGGFLWDNLRGLTPTSDDRLYRFKPSGNTGEFDYKFDTFMIGRQEFDGIWSQQVFVKDGGLKARTDGLSGDLGMSSDWMYAFNFDLDFPRKLPFSLYWNVAKSSVNPIVRFSEFKDEFRPFDYAEIGVTVKIVRGAIEVYLPLLFNEELEEAVNLTSETFAQKISFLLDLNKLRLLKNIRENGIDGMRRFQ